MPFLPEWSRQMLEYSLGQSAEPKISWHQLLQFRISTWLLFVPLLAWTALSWRNAIQFSEFDSLGWSMLAIAAFLHWKGWRLTREP